MWGHPTPLDEKNKCFSSFAKFHFAQIKINKNRIYKCKDKFYLGGLKNEKRRY